MTPAELPVFAPGPDASRVRTREGGIRAVPRGWVHVPPGDPALTRRLKAGGPDACWLVEERRGRRRFSRGVYAPADVVERVRTALQTERADPAYGRRLASSRARRAKAEEAGREDFRTSVLAFLDFPLQHRGLAERLAERVTAHATPVGSGTVARTRRIPVERRAEAAVIAWLRHETTAYDSMRIPREKGRRRDVRRLLAERSRELLDRYRRSEVYDGESCPLRDALGS